MLSDDVQVIVDGKIVNADMTPVAALHRAVAISLFTWRRAQPGDVGPEQQRWGWWGDTTAEPSGSRIGSRLWLLSREKLLPETIARAKDYVREALAWLTEDGVASRVDVTAQRQGLDRLDVLIAITRSDGSQVDLRFADFWRSLYAI